jgi:glycosyltransferase involved in cell wall biosynthesis
VFSVGLVGSASSKKNYTHLLNRFNALRLSNILFTVYGFETPYLDSVKSNSPYPIEVCNSSTHDFADFFSSINVVVNISLNEGFCRPVAAALSSGMPVYLLDCPVVREFYASSPAHIADDVDDIVRDIVFRYNLS